MKILLAAATKEEIIEDDFKHCSVVITGVGMVNTAFSLTKNLTETAYDLVINMGLAGSFSDEIKIGDVVEVIEDNFSEIILTEGSLGVLNTINQSEIIIIKPGVKAKVDYAEGQIELSNVNTVLYTSWIDGRIIFRDESIYNMITKLERIYNVIIINNNDYLKEVFVNATFLTEEESIEDVLEYLKEIYEIDYQIINDKIIIN